MNFSRISLFQGIEETDCRAMMKCFHAYTRDYRRGDTVFDFGQGANTVGIVRSGIVSMVRIDEEGVRTILETLQENSVFGEVFTFSRIGAHGVCAVCETDCQILFLDYDHLTKRCEKACAFHSRLVQNMLWLISQKAVAQSEKIEVLSQRSIREKLLCYFRFQAQKHGRSFSLPFSMSALADYICVDRSAMMREMKKMREEGLLTAEKGHIELLQTEDNPIFY